MALRAFACRKKQKQNSVNVVQFVRVHHSLWCAVLWLAHDGLARLCLQDRAGEENSGIRCERDEDTACCSGERQDAGRPNCDHVVMLAGRLFQQRLGASKHEIQTA
jgi:hypothetical protein